MPTHDRPAKNEPCQGKLVTPEWHQDGRKRTTINERGRHPTLGARREFFTGQRAGKKARWPVIGYIKQRRGAGVTSSSRGWQLETRSSAAAQIKPIAGLFVLVSLTLARRALVIASLPALTLLAAGLTALLVLTLLVLTLLAAGLVVLLALVFLIVVIHDRFLEIKCQADAMAR